MKTNEILITDEIITIDEDDDDNTTIQSNHNNPIIGIPILETHLKYGKTK